jgi:hypothetical protein
MEPGTEMTEPTDRVTPFAGNPESPGSTGFAGLPHYPASSGAPGFDGVPVGEPPAGFQVPHPRSENDWVHHPNAAPPRYPGAAGPPAGMGAAWGWPAPPVPKPGVIPLRRLGMGEILDGAISYIRANPVVTLGLSAVVTTIAQLVQVPAAAVTLRSLQAPVTGLGGNQVFSQMLRASSSGAAILGGVVSFIATTVLTGLLIVVLSRAVLGQRPSFGEVWTATRSRILGLLGLALLSGLAMGAVFVVAFAPMVVALVAGSSSVVAVLLGVAGFLVAACLTVWLWVSWSLAAPAYILEGVSVVGALRRSFRLVRSQWWRVFGILLLSFIITVVLAAILQTPFTIGGTVLAATLGAKGGTLLPTLVVTAIGTIIANTIAQPFRAGVVGLLYFDQRIRREGLDLELAQAAETGSGWGAVTPSQA